MSKIRGRVCFGVASLAVWFLVFALLLSRCRGDLAVCWGVWAKILSLLAVLVVLLVLLFVVWHAQTDTLSAPSGRRVDILTSNEKTAGTVLARERREPKD